MNLERRVAYRGYRVGTARQNSLGNTKPNGKVVQEIQVLVSPCMWSFASSPPKALKAGRRLDTARRRTADVQQQARLSSGRLWSANTSMKEALGVSLGRHSFCLKRPRAHCIQWQIDGQDSRGGVIGCKRKSARLR